MSLPLHRDIYVGMVVENLSKKGCFGTEINLYSFYAWDGTISAYTFSDESTCVLDMFHRYEQGQLLSDYILYKERVYEAANASKPTLEALYQQAQEKLTARCNEAFRQKVAHYQSKPTVCKELLIASYLDQLPETQKPLIPGLIALALAQKWISPAFAHKYPTTPLADATTQQQTFAGFAYVKDQCLYYYSNAYLPNVWRKWQQSTRQGQLTSGIILQPLPSTETAEKSCRKAAFDIYLTTVLNKEVFNFIQSVQD